jgi:hypothetical protein
VSADGVSWSDVPHARPTPRLCLACDLAWVGPPAAKRKESKWWLVSTSQGWNVGDNAKGAKGKRWITRHSGKAVPAASGWWGVLVLVVLIVVGVSLSQTAKGHSLLQHAGLYGAPASYTELSFTAPENLPSKLNSARTRIDVSFRIHNVSGASGTYHWSITLVHSGQALEQITGVTTAPSQGQATVAKTVLTSCVGGRLQVIVRLVAPSESIDFWTTCVS